MNPGFKSALFVHFKSVVALTGKTWFIWVSWLDFSTGLRSSESSTVVKSTVALIHSYALEQGTCSRIKNTRMERGTVHNGSV